MTEETDAIRALTDRYDRNAATYREFWAPLLRSVALPLVHELKGHAEIVLDVGAGAGTLLDDLAGAFPAARIVGVDRSRGMLSLAPARFARAQVDARQLPIASRSVDRVFMVFMLFHLDDPLQGLIEARRVLRAGGRLGILTWGGELESTATRIWNECLDQHGAMPADPATDARHDALDGPEKLAALLNRAGLATPRAWADELVATIEAEHLVRIKTGIGSSKVRFDSMPPEAATACVVETRGRFEDLAPEDFVARAPIVYATAGV
jgi:SAM-dependent methyltransferase